MRGAVGIRLTPCRARRRLERRQIDVALDQIGQRRQPRRQRRILLRLHQSEMPLRHGQRGVAPDRAEHGDADPLTKPSRTSAAWRVARDLVEDHAGDRRRRRDSAQNRARPRRPIAPARRHRAPARRAIRSPPRYRRSSRCPRRRARRRRRTAPSRPPPARDRRRRRPAAAHRTGRAPCAQESRLNEARPAAIAVERRIDIIRSAFVGLHDPAAAAQRGEQRQRQRGLAAAAGAARR